jgi:hypothetical protein
VTSTRACLPGLLTIVAMTTLQVRSRPAAAQVGDQAPAAVISVWYRGSPPGTPRVADLTAFARAGVSSVTWPSRLTAHEIDLFRLASSLGLQVQLEIDGPPVTLRANTLAGGHATVRVSDFHPEEFPAVAWRMLAHGARTVSFDPGAGEAARPLDADGRAVPWAAAVTKVAGEVAANASLTTEWRPADAVRLEGESTGALDLVLLEVPRSWVLVVTNAARTEARGVARLPAGVPAALWVDLLDGSMMSMINEPAGPTWSLTLPPAAAHVYVVNKEGSHLVVWRSDNWSSRLTTDRWLVSANLATPVVATPRNKM